MGYHLIAVIQKTAKNLDEGAKKRELLDTVGENANYASTVENSLEI